MGWNQVALVREVKGLLGGLGDSAPHRVGFVALPLAMFTSPPDVILCRKLDPEPVR